MSDLLIGAVRKAWQDADAVIPGNRVWRAVKVDCPGPLKVLGGIRATDNAVSLLFETPIEHAPVARARFEADGVSMIESRNYADQTYRIAVTLEQRALADIFDIVSTDLIDASAGQCKPRDAVSAVVTRLAAWQAFLKARHSGLGPLAVLGLIGELIVLRRISEVVGWTDAVVSWKGPSGGVQDFSRAGIAVEVKTGAGITSGVDISSLDQLDDTALDELLLAHVHLAEASEGTSLPSIVASISDDVACHAPASLRNFTDALLAAGYSQIDADRYSRTYMQIGIRFYRIGSAFPRLTRGSVPPAIAGANYRLDLRLAHEHLVDDPYVTDVISKMRAAG